MSDPPPAAAADSSPPAHAGETGAHDMMRAPEAPSLESEKARASREDASGGGRHWLDYATAIFAFIAAIGGAAAGVFGGWQASVANDSEKRSLRPYVNISADVVIPPGANPAWRFPLSADNNGDTQTDRAQSQVWCVRKDSPADDPMAGAPIAKAKRFFGPKQHIGIGQCAFTTEQMNAAAAGRGVLFVAARIVYFDRFDRTTPHTTEFCQRLENIKLNASPPAMDSETCDSHNCADDECPKQD